MTVHPFAHPADAPALWDVWKPTARSTFLLSLPFLPHEEQGVGPAFLGAWEGVEWSFIQERNCSCACGFVGFFFLTRRMVFVKFCVTATPSSTAEYRASGRPAAPRALSLRRLQHHFLWQEWRYSTSPAILLSCPHDLDRVAAPRTCGVRWGWRAAVCCVACRPALCGAQGLRGLVSGAVSHLEPREANRFLPWSSPISETRLCCLLQGAGVGAKEWVFAGSAVMWDI